MADEPAKRKDPLDILVPGLTLPNGVRIPDAELIRLLRVEAKAWKERAVASAEEEGRLRAIISLLLRAHAPNETAILSLDVLTTIREEGKELEYVIDKKRRDVLVRLLVPEAERPPHEPGAGEPLGQYREEQAGGKTP